MKTKLAYLVRFSPNNNCREFRNAGKNLRTYRAAQRGIRTLRKIGYRDVYIASIVVPATDKLRK